MRSRTKLAIALLLPVALAGAAPMPRLPGPGELTVEILSSRPDQVTGGDARLRIRLPHGVSARGLRVELATPPGTRGGARTGDPAGGERPAGEGGGTAGNGEPDGKNRDRDGDGGEERDGKGEGTGKGDADDTGSGGGSDGSGDGGGKGRARLKAGGGAVRTGTDVTRAFDIEPGGRSLTGVVTGLRTGWHTVRARVGTHRGAVSLRNRATLSGPYQYPFVCKTDRNGLGQPIVDNRDRRGLRIFAQNRDGSRRLKVVGWSRDCAARTRVDHLYRTAAGQFRPLVGRPRDVAVTKTADGRTVPYVVRRERGTVNRFVYSITSLVEYVPGRDPRTLRALWNHRLIYRFGGGIGVGHDQGVLADGDSLYHEGLALGYAVVSSTGTQTGVHLDLRLGAETAFMVKERFVERYGVPDYTVGTGGSGGALQQYVYGQHRPGLIDAAIPQFGYPDIATQIVNIGDCELLERYADTTPGWRQHANRMLLEGMAASDHVRLPVGRPVGGATTCTKGWRGITPLLFNPTYAPAQPEWPYMDPPGVMDRVRWTHWDDLRAVYGERAGYGRRTWDNVGVQYGLRALRQGQLTPEQFLDLNARIGGWRPAAKMRKEVCPYVPQGCNDQDRWDPWSSRNATGRTARQAARKPAPRSQADPGAVRAAYGTGQVFTGDIGIPIIDLRPYLDAQLDIHDSVQSFVARQRIVDARGRADNHVIWLIDARPFPAIDEVGQALRVMDTWLAGVRAGRGVAAARPAAAVDRCSDVQGRRLAAGPHVWDGILDDRTPGACARRFAVHSTPRLAAGQPYGAGIVKCRVQPVRRAIAHGVYAPWRPSGEQRKQLQRIFPSGVCDYGRAVPGAR